MTLVSTGAGAAAAEVSTVQSAQRPFRDGRRFPRALLCVFVFLVCSLLAVVCVVHWQRRDLSGISLHELSGVTVTHVGAGSGQSLNDLSGVTVTHVGAGTGHSLNDLSGVTVTHVGAGTGQSLNDSSGVTVTHVGASNGPSRAEIRSRQILNYQGGQALIVNIHVTHHAGTSFCKYMRDAGPVPSFSCMVCASCLWTRNNTAREAALLRTKFHMISFQFGRAKSTPLADVDFETPGVVSIYVTRDPMDRALAGDARVAKLYGPEKLRSSQRWKQFAESEHTNNFALNRILRTTREGQLCAEGEATPAECVEKAKALLSRFTFVLDQACFAQSLQVLSKELGLPPPKLRPAKIHASARERINNTELYNFMTRRMRRDIELYQWSKEISLVHCEQ